MKTTHIGAALVVALLVQTSLVPVLVEGSARVDLVLVVVVFAALSRGPIVGLWSGTCGGLLQDALSGGVVGVSGLTKTIIGVLVGVASSQFIVGTVWHRLTLVFVASVIHALCYIGVYGLIAQVDTVATMEMVAVQAVANAVVGVLAEGVVRLTPSLSERARHGRRSSTRRHWMMT